MLKNLSAELITGLFLRQAGLSLIICSISAGFWGTRACTSSVIGVIAWLIPNYVFALKWLKMNRELTPKQKVADLYLASITKFIFSGSIFVIAIILMPVNFIAMVISYFLMTVFFAVNMGFLSHLWQKSERA